MPGEHRLNTVKKSAAAILGFAAFFNRQNEVRESAMFFVYNLRPSSQAECRRFDPGLPFQQNE